MTEKMSARSDEIMKKVAAEAKQKKESVRAQLAEAKEKLPTDKELFDIDKFQQIYDLTNDRGESLITPTVIENLEIQYYLDNPDMKTMEEFAKHRTMLDSHDVN